MVALSAAVGSVPSLIAFRKRRRRDQVEAQSAGASIAKMLSEAPTGVPAYVALIVAITPS